MLLPADFNTDLTRLLNELARDRVVVIGRVAKDARTTATVEWRPAASLDDIDRALRTVGPVDLIIDLLPDQTYLGDVFRRLFFHLKPNGVYAFQRRSGRSDVTERPAGFLRSTWLENATEPPLSYAVPAPLVTADVPEETKDLELEQELRAACGRVTFDRSWLLVQQRLRYYLKLHEAEVATILPPRNVDATVNTLATYPGGELHCRGTVVNHPTASPVRNMDLDLPYPELRLQHYTGRLAMISNQLVIADQTVLPASYRYPFQRHNPRVTNVGTEFGRIAPRLHPKTDLAGSYYHLDAWNSGHFGHTLAEVVSRLWGYHLAKQAMPDLKVLFRLRYPDERVPELELILFEAYGIDRGDVLWVGEPVWLESLVTATAMWQNDRPFFVHPQITDVWAKLGSALVTPRSDSPARVFVSRRAGQSNRTCRNVGAVEDIFAAHGFEIVYPEDLPFPEQATLFGHAEVVAGFSGSALFNAMFATRMQNLIVLSHEAYTARYEHLFTMVLGCTTHYFWSTPDVSHPPGRWTWEAYYSPWQFDIDRNGPALVRLLSELP